MRLPSALCTKQTARLAESHTPKFQQPKAGVKPWMGKRNPVMLVSAEVKRNSAVVTGNLCEANIPPTTISPLPIATRVIMTCKIVKAPSDIPRIMESSGCWPTRSQAEECATLIVITAGICDTRNKGGRDVRFGSKADIEAPPPDVRLPPKADIG